GGRVVVGPGSRARPSRGGGGVWVGPPAPRGAPPRRGGGLVRPPVRFFFHGQPHRGDRPPQRGKAHRQSESLPEFTEGRVGVVADRGPDRFRMRPPRCGSPPRGAWGGLSGCPAPLLEPANPRLTDAILGGDGRRSHPFVAVGQHPLPQIHRVCPHCKPSWVCISHTRYVVLALEGTEKRSRSYDTPSALAKSFKVQSLSWFCPVL